MQKNKRKFRFTKQLVLLACAILLGGCSTVAPVAEDRQAKEFNLLTRKSQVYLSRNANVFGFAAPFPIMVDKQKIGELSNGNFFLFEVSPGPHLFEVWSGGLFFMNATNVWSNKQTIQAVRGKNYFIKVTPNFRLIPGQPPASLRQMTEAEGKESVGNAKLQRKLVIN